MPDEPTTVQCAVCGQQVDPLEATPVELVRPVLLDLLNRTQPGPAPAGFICHQDLEQLRSRYVQDVLEAEMGELSDLEQQVVRSYREHELISENINTQFDRELTFGERLADRVADFGGSWAFILSFFFALLFWIVLNALWLAGQAYDPYPFILLNLILSCLAAIQAPIIMMSQNRQEAKDRLRAEHDYRVNLKAELEIRHLNAKLDLLINRQWHRLLQIQQLQTDLMEELLSTRSGDRSEANTPSSQSDS